MKLPKSLYNYTRTHHLWYKNRKKLHFVCGTLKMGNLHLTNSVKWLKSRQIQQVLHCHNWKWMWKKHKFTVVSYYFNNVLLMTSSAMCHDVITPTTYVNSQCCFSILPTFQLTAIYLRLKWCKIIIKKKRLRLSRQSYSEIQTAMFSWPTVYNTWASCVTVIGPFVYPHCTIKHTASTKYMNHSWLSRYENTQGKIHLHFLTAFSGTGTYKSLLMSYI